MESKHTKEIWTLEEDPFWGNRVRVNVMPTDNTLTTILVIEDYTTDKEIAKANAERIVHCVNNFQEIDGENEILKRKIAEYERTFYLNVCRAYNAGKRNMAACVQAYADNNSDNDAFKSSHDYFVSEFPSFKTNVP